MHILGTVFLGLSFVLKSCLHNLQKYFIVYMVKSNNNLSYDFFFFRSYS